MDEEREREREREKERKKEREREKFTSDALDETIAKLKANMP